MTMPCQVAICLDMVVTMGSSSMLAPGEMSQLTGESFPAVAWNLLGSDQRVYLLIVYAVAKV